ncbi:MAG: RecX family transcriptional regulator [Chitinophagaceae bacterium]|nr:RecX family transcriptional regulator [Chitinophagaceae bacterium]
MDDSILEKIKYFCAYQERSQYEVRSKLLGMKIYGDDLELYIVALLEENFINEERFSKAYAGGKFRVKHWGRQKIVQGLKQHKISVYCIKAGLAEIKEEDYRLIFNQLAEQKLASLQKERSVWNKKAKLRNFLLQRGFEDEYIYEFIRNNLS